jgi:hypothetical protein
MGIAGVYLLECVLLRVCVIAAVAWEGPRVCPFRVSVRARERDRQLGDLPPAICSPG